jgi:hypothetical protein
MLGFLGYLDPPSQRRHHCLGEPDRNEERDLCIGIRQVRRKGRLGHDARKHRAKLGRCTGLCRIARPRKSGGATRIAGQPAQGAICAVFREVHTLGVPCGPEFPDVISVPDLPRRAFHEVDILLVLRSITPRERERPFGQACQGQV